MIAALLIAAAVFLPASSNEPGDTLLRFGRFGTVTVYRPAQAPNSVALFFSGDGGWNQGVVDMARAATANGTLILGVDTPRYLKGVDAGGDHCSYFAGDAELLSQYAQKALGLSRYLTPILIGYSSGAGLVYAALAQAPDNTFQGAVSIGFDPELPTQTLVCERNGLSSVRGAQGKGRVLAPVHHLPAPWIVLQGERDVVSPFDSVRTFVGAVPQGELIALPGVGHGFSKPAAWLPQFEVAVARLAPRATAEVSPASGVDLGDLPIVELPQPAQPGDCFAIVLSGDGGWSSIDKQIAQELVRAGLPTVGFNSLQYFWTRRTPEGSSLDLARLIRHYQLAYRRRKVVLVGYSRGADVLPLMAARLPASMLDDIRLMAFLGIDHETDMEFRVGDWFSQHPVATYKLLPEVRKLAGHTMLCVYGTKEQDTLCPELPDSLVEVVRLDGGHHFDGDYRGLARLILARLPEIAPAPD